MCSMRVIGVIGFATCVYATAALGGDVVRLDPVLDKLLDPDAKVEAVKSGFGFTEGPVWVQKGKTGYLLFSDIPANVIYKLIPGGEASVYLDHSGYTKPDIWRVGFEFNNGKDPNDPAFAKFYMSGSNGLALDPQGRLVVATFAGRSIDRIEPNGKRTVLADSYDGSASTAPMTWWSRKTGRSTSPICSVRCGKAIKTRPWVCLTRRSTW